MIDKGISNDKFTNVELNQNFDAPNTVTKSKQIINSLHRRIHLKKNKCEDYEDELLYCYECNEECVGECSIHTSQWILNKKIICPYTSLRTDLIFDQYYNENLEISECFCKANKIKHIKTTLPNGFFLVKSQVENTTYGIWTKSCITRGTILGPFIGHLTNEAQIAGASNNDVEDGVHDFIWSLTPTINVCGNTLVDARDCMQANYLRFIRRSHNKDEHNLVPIQFDGKIFYQALRNILTNEELMVSYAVRTLNPKNYEGVLLIRMIPSSCAVLSSNHVLESNSNIQKSTTSNRCLTSSDSSDIQSVSINDAGEYSTPKYVTRNNNPDNISSRCDTSRSKVDDEVRNFLKEILEKHPTISTTEINETLRKMLPHKPILSDRTVLSTILKNNMRPLFGFDDVLDDERVYRLVQLFRENPDLSCQDAKIALERLYPDKSPVTFETIDRVIRINNLRASTIRSRRITDAMCDFMRKMLKNNPWMHIKDLNKELQTQFPNQPKVGVVYLNQFVYKKKLRPIRNAKIKMDDEMRKFIHELYFNEGCCGSVIYRRLCERFPNKPFVSCRLVGSVIASFNASDQDKASN